MGGIASVPGDWSYIDVMTAALAMTGLTHLQADDERWHEAWQRVLDDPEARALLPDVHFPAMSAYQPISDEVETFRRVLSWSNVLSLGNPRFRYSGLSADAARRLQDRYQPLIEAHRPTLERIAETLRERLAADPADVGTR